MNPALERLRAGLRDYVLAMSAAYVGDGRWPLEKIRGSFEREHAPYGVLEKILLLDEPRDGVPLVKQALAHDNSIIVMDAAAILIILGDSSGLPPLQRCLIDRPPMTASGFEQDVIAAILALHGEPFQIARGPATPLRPLIESCRSH
jgi:hypothetical protein